MKFQKSAGSASRTLIILAFVVLLAIGVVYWATRLAGGKKVTDSQSKNGNQVQVYKPVYDTNIGDTRFILQSSVDLGNTLRASKTSGQQDVTTTERFIRVIVAAQNKGKTDTSSYAWDLGNIIDSDGRVFEAVTNKVYYFLPNPDLCGAILKPEFEPTPCVRIYEVANISKNLKIQVIATAPNSNRKQQSFLDLNLGN